MRSAIAMAAAATLASAAAAQAAVPGVEIKDAAARVIVIPENRADLRVEVVSPNPRLPLRVKTGRRVVVDGGLHFGRIHNCRGAGEAAVVSIAGLGEVPWRELPQIVIHAPRDVDVSTGGAVYGAIGRAASVTLGNAGCGDWTVGNVDGELKVSQAGSGDTRTGSAVLAKLRTAGSGDISTGDVRGRVDVDVAGSGDVSVRSVAGPLDVHVAGSGDVKVGGGRASEMTASIAGSGNVIFDGVAESLNARIAGSGDVRARQVRGAVRRSVMGSGKVRIG